MARIRKLLTNDSTSAIVWNTALYIRLSREDGNEVSYSVTNQKQVLQNYVDAHENEFEVVSTYTDDGFTGTDSNREEFQRMLRDVREHKINCVIVKDLSRLSRNYVEAGHYLEVLFAEYDVRFISLDLPSLDSYKQPEQMNSIIVPIQNVINDDFCRQTSIKIRKVFNMKRSRGEFIGAFAPYGYAKNPIDKGSFIVDEESANVVKDIYKWFVQDSLSKNGIAHKLNGLGIPNPAAYKKQKGFKYQNPNIEFNDSLWSSTTVGNILQNQVYLGHMVQGRQKVKSYKVHTRVLMPEEEWYIVENTHDAIVDKDMFEKAQALQQRDTRTAPKKNEVYLFSGFVRCADCKKAMHRRTSKSLVYYACRTYTGKSKEKCTKHTIRLDILEEAVLAAIRAQIALVGNLVEIIKEINDAPIVLNQSRRLDTMLKSRKQELEKATGVLDSLYMDWKSGDITKEQYRRMSVKLESQIDGLSAAIENLKVEQSLLAEGVDAQNPYLTHFLKYQGIEQLDRGILGELINTIYVHEGGELTIIFNFADQHKRVHEFIDNNNPELIVMDDSSVG